MRIGPHEVLSELGRGGMGVVYRVRTPDGREAALKVLERLEPDRFARFERERRLLASLGEEEGFVGLLDAGVSEGPSRRAWLLMPLVPGGTLRDRLARGPLGVDETLSLGVALARAVGAAHARGIVHRDLKPENVLFTASGRPLVADLGLAKHFDRGAPGASQSVSLSRHGVARGTAGYMAPEQLEDAASVGPQADVFSLGVVLYECLAGRPAFEGDSALEVFSSMTSGVQKAIGRPEVPGWLEKTILRALAVERSERFPDAASLARALSNPGRERRWRLALVVPALLGAAIGAAVLSLVLRGEPARPQPPPPGAPRPAPPTAPAPAPLGERLDELERGVRALEASGVGQHSPAPERVVTLAKDVFARLEKDLAPVERSRALALLSDLTYWLSYDMAPTNLDLADAFSLLLLRLDGEKPGRRLELRALALFARQRYAEALAVHDEMLRLRVFPTILRSQRAFALAGSGNGEDAALRELALAPGDGVKEAGAAVSGLARCVALREKVASLTGAEALATAEQAVAAFEGNGEAYYVRAGARGQLDADGAYEDYTRCYESRSPSAALAILARARLQKDLRASREDIDRAIELDPELEVGYASRAGLEARDSDLDAALRDVEKALALARKHGIPEEQIRQVESLHEDIQRRRDARR
jgi:tetratricopeptide (TPR) repeat protein